MLAESRRMYRQQRKVLVRLEQSISAAMQRSLTKRKALAILYGQHLRYYMTKTEVWSDSSCLLEFHIQDVSVHFIFKHHTTASNLRPYYRLLILQWFNDLFMNLLISALSKCFLFPIACPSPCRTPWFRGLPCFSIPYLKCGSAPWCLCCLFGSSAWASRSSVASYLLEVIKTGTLLCCPIILMVQEWICYQTHIQL